MARGLVCVGCQRFLKIKKNDVSVEEGMPDGVGGWQPYKLWSADLYECPGRSTRRGASAARRWSP